MYRLILTVSLAILAAAGLCYPRRSQVTGVLFAVAGALMFVVWAAGAIGDALPVAALTSAGLGLGMLWRFRHPGARAAHVTEWAGKFDDGRLVSLVERRRSRIPSTRPSPPGPGFQSFR